MTFFLVFDIEYVSCSPNVFNSINLVLVKNISIFFFGKSILPKSKIRQRNKEKNYV